MKQLLLVLAFLCSFGIYKPMHAQLEGHAYPLVYCLAEVAGMITCDYLFDNKNFTINNYCNVGTILLVALSYRLRFALSDQPRTTPYSYLSFFTMPVFGMLAVFIGDQLTKSTT